MKKYPSITFLLLLFFTTSLYCQKGVADSLLGSLSQLKGEKKVDALNKISDIYNNIDCKIAIDYAWQAMQIASEINYQSGLATSYGCLGFSNINIDKQKAIYYTNKALQIRRTLNDRPGIGRSLNVLGLINYFTGDYTSSIENHLQALKIREEIGDANALYSSYNNISLVYLTLEDYNTALEYLNKALAVSLKVGRSPAIIYDNIGDIYSRTGKYDQAFSYFEKSIALHKKNGNKKSEANSFMLIAVTYQRLADTTNALANYRLARKIYAAMEEKNGLAQSYNGMAEIYKNLKMYSPAIEHAKNALQSALPIHQLEKISIAAEILHYCYDRIGDKSKAYDYLLLYHNTLDSLQSIQKYKKLTKIEFDYKIEQFKKEQEIALARQKTFNVFFGITISLLIIIVLLALWGYKNKKKLSIKLSELNEKLQDLNSAKDRFFSIIAHDLRGPFQGLLGTSEMLSAQAGSLNSSEIQEVSQGLNQALQKQFRLLNDLLDWSRLQSGNFSLSMERICLRNELATVFESVSFSAAQKEISLVNDINENLSVTADRNMIKLVFRNLISNSIKFTPEGGVVKVSASGKKPEVELTVEDNGIGISEENLQKLFRIDVHHSTKGTNKEQGTGLGLILCKEVIEKHSGKIRIDSKLGHGSKFIITLPA